ncbi:hypothetical protein [Erythrobacter sanguineus]|uniref:Uncharacterized protein n=1 Tax=Erythrobacter sanguineus TaxID=198312 RepID=A0A1M7RYS4_9SPHN|nr:hypothetical protein [Erythrobacter sanguineus]SHN51300.1 hypothetical protein SAMN02745193_00634 [Erythrobacter sanguineus]
MKPAAGGAPARGVPLLMIGLVLAGWVAGRALLWESPFLAAAVPSATAAAGAPSVPVPEQGATVTDPLPAATDAPPPAPAQAGASAGRVSRLASLRLPSPRKPAGLLPRMPTGPAAPPQRPGKADAAMAIVPRRLSGMAAPTSAPAPAPVSPLSPPAAPAPRGDRWSLDVWGFWRQGSDAAPISQGRVPVYGASQIGAVLQYRLAPGSEREPRLYARAYRALVRRGENELALGASLRPLPRVPVRVLGEVRLTDGAFRNELRPAVFAVTEIAPISLPLGTRLEAYGQAGWVGGADATPFADGQAKLTREIGAVAGATDGSLRLSVGAGAWGGAQEGAQRIDIGPTVRLDFAVGEVPARLAFDWREQVGGDAGPDSGLAVTLSTQF